ncbi:MAG: hypothetical protein HYU69_06840 [Bacteroidetes bacterium]|nr:hypothetical protein [Bacteroidota bacterium]
MKDKLFFLNIFLSFAFSAHAQYIDPGSGSYIFQLLLGGFLALTFYFKTIKDILKSLAVRAFKLIKKSKDAR